jgi:hypothetical protein
MLNKFQDQYLLANVEKLEDIKKVMMRHFKQVNICLKIDKVISDMKSINPLLFSYPKEARYLSGKYDPTITE